MKRLIIGCPFGNYYQPACATATLGTYTLRHRAGFIKRFWRVISTVRYDRRTQSWINELGLPNSGIDSLKGQTLTGKILSIHGFNVEEWYRLIDRAVLLDPEALELNFSCPNVTSSTIQECVLAATHTRQYRGLVIAKLGPIKWMRFVRPLIDLGITGYHLCNTIPTPGGGISGNPLKQYSLWAIEEVAGYCDGLHIIGGGGVTCEQDILDYINAGADHVSICSALFNPLNWYRIKGWAEVLESRLGSLY